MALLFTTGAMAQVSTDTIDNIVPRQLQLVALASHLVRYGYAQKSALPLIQAVQICKELGVVDADSGEQKTQCGIPVSSTLVKGEPVAFEESKILADAMRFADGDKTLLALIKDTQKVSRGAVNGPIRRVDRVLAGYTDTWIFTFKGGEMAYVYVSGDGDTDLTVNIYDMDGNLVVSDEDYCHYDDFPTFTPRWTSKYQIKIKNLGKVYNNYVLITN